MEMASLLLNLTTPSSALSDDRRGRLRTFAAPRTLSTSGIVPMIDRLGEECPVAHRGLVARAERTARRFAEQASCHQPQVTRSQYWLGRSAQRIPRACHRATSLPSKYVMLEGVNEREEATHGLSSS